MRNHRACQLHELVLLVDRSCVLSHWKHQVTSKVGVFFYPHRFCLLHELSLCLQRQEPTCKRKGIQNAFFAQVHKWSALNLWFSTQAGLHFNHSHVLWPSRLRYRFWRALLPLLKTHPEIRTGGLCVSWLWKNGDSILSPEGGCCPKYGEGPGIRKHETCAPICHPEILVASAWLSSSILSIQPKNIHVLGHNLLEMLEMLVEGWHFWHLLHFLNGLLHVIDAIRWILTEKNIQKYVDGGGDCV